MKKLYILLLSTGMLTAADFIDLLNTIVQKDQPYTESQSLFNPLLAKIVSKDTKPFVDKHVRQHLSHEELQHLNELTATGIFSKVLHALEVAEKEHTQEISDELKQAHLIPFGKELKISSSKRKISFSLSNSTTERADSALSSDIDL